MKKVLAVFLAAVMMLSCFGMAAFAADGEEIKVPIEVTFKYLVNTYDENGVANGVKETTFVQTMEKGTVITAEQMNSWVNDIIPKKVTYDYTVTEDYTTRTESVTHTFMYFTVEGEDSSIRYTFEGTGTNTVDESCTFVANYEVKDTIDNYTFWEFVQSVFARINKIFEYFSEIFGF